MTRTSAARRPSDDAPVAVVGAGFAGLSAALDLLEAGRNVVLVEKRPFPGGKAYSFLDPAHGASLDNGHHVTMRCCAALHRLLARCGCDHLVEYQPALRVPVFDPATRRWSEIASSSPGGPLGRKAPWHLAASVARFSHLTIGERARLGFAVRALRRESAGAAALDRRTFADWLREHRQTPRTIARFWDLILRPVCNDGSEDVSAAQALQVFRDGFLAGPRAADLGLFRADLGEIAGAVLRRVRGRGGTVLRRRATGIGVSDGRLREVRFANGPPLQASAVVLAIPPNGIDALVPEPFRHRAPFSDLPRFSTSPIVNVHLKYDATVMDRPFAAVLDDRAQFVFDRSRLLGLDAPEHWVSVSLSAAREPMERSPATLVDRAAAGLAEAFPRATRDRLRGARVVREPEATFRPLPGMAAIRPGPRTPISGLFLAGAWTDTGWPATLESAVRSGNAAASAVLGANRD